MVDQFKSLANYEYDPSLPKIEPSLEKKRRFVEEFFTSGEITVAYLRTIDPDCPRSKARDLAERMITTDKFVVDLMGIARKNVVGSITGLLAEHTSILAELRDEARADGKFAPAIAAEIARGKALGLYDRQSYGNMVNKEPTDMSSEELAGLIESVSRLPQAERLNVVRMLTSTPDGGLLTDDEIEGDFNVLGNEDEDD